MVFDVEQKHDFIVKMMAAIGYITSEITGKPQCVKDSRAACVGKLLIAAQTHKDRQSR